MISTPMADLDNPNNTQLSQYVTHYTPIDEAVPTTAAHAPPQDQAPVQPAEGVEQPGVTAPKISASKARVEYRDQHGNVLPEDLVASLRKEGKVKFETRYESRLENAHEVDIVNGQVAPPHPEVEGQNPETRGKPEDAVPPESPASVAQGNEPSVERQSSQEARPASEGFDATQ